LFREGVVSKMFYCEVAEGDFVFKQGDDASAFFVIGKPEGVFWIRIWVDKGSMEILVNNKHRKCLGETESFGELALLYNAPRSASVRAIGKSFLWGIDRNSFKTAVDEINTKDFDENRKFLDNVKFFGSFHF
jgi:cGMP-dependent protein kinase 1